VYPRSYVDNPARRSPCASGPAPGNRAAQRNRSCCRCRTGRCSPITLASSRPGAPAWASDDTQVGLVGHQSSFRSSLVKPFFSSRQAAISDIRRTAYLKHLRPLLVDIVHTLLDGFLAGGVKRPASGNVEDAPGTSTSCWKSRIPSPGPAASASAAPARRKEHTGRTILIVENGRHRIAAIH